MNNKITEAEVIGKVINFFGDYLYEKIGNCFKTESCADKTKTLINRMKTGTTQSDCNEKLAQDVRTFLTHIVEGDRNVHAIWVDGLFEKINKERAMRNSLISDPAYEGLV